jgi:hypothetical protein
VLYVCCFFSAHRNILSPLTWKLLFSTRLLLPLPDHMRANSEDCAEDSDEWSQTSSVRGPLTAGDKQRLLPPLPPLPGDGSIAADDSAAASLVFHFNGYGNANGYGNGSGNADMAAMATPAFAPPPLAAVDGAEFANLFAELPNLLQGVHLPCSFLPTLSNHDIHVNLILKLRFLSSCFCISP